MENSSDKQIAFQPLLMGRSEMAAALSISTDLLDELRKRGLPCVTIPGSSKILFHPGTVVEWMLEQSKPIETLSEKEAGEKLDSLLKNE